MCLCATLLLLSSLHPASAQTSTPAPAQDLSLLRVFVDCYECDTEYLRQNVMFVDYVRDRTVADVHLLVTTQSTGGGGWFWTVKFIGLGRFDKVDRTITFNTPQTATSDDRRKAFARYFKLGIATYALDSTVAGELDVQWTKPATAPAAAAPATRDPWNYWVFRTNFGGNRDGEESQSFSSYRLSFSANRTTNNWKLNLATSGNYSTSRFDLGNGDIVKSSTHSWNVTSMAVQSVMPRWSVGGRSSVSASSFSNNKLVVSLTPAIEFSVFPYSESSRRVWTVMYTGGVSLYRYKEATIYDKLEDIVPNHSLRTNISFRQPWGSSSVGITASQHFNRLSRYRISTYASADVRLFKGFSINGYGGYDRIRDQIGLRKGSASAEEVLLRRRQLATGHSYYLGFGLSYSFGSIYNSVVNTRFGNF